MPGNNIVKILEQVKKTVVFLGDGGGEVKPSFYATGCLLSFQGMTHLVTAKHVVIDNATQQERNPAMRVFYNNINGVGCARAIQDVRSQFGTDWVFHVNPDVDIAILPWGIDPSTDDLLTIPNEVFAKRDRLFQLYETFQLSYQPGIPDEGKMLPIIRSGTISKFNQDGTLYVDSAAFPGNSGSPVFLTPSLVRFEDTAPFGVDPMAGNFVGIVGEYIPYQDLAVSAQTGRPRVVFEENTGLSKVWPASLIEEVSQTPLALAQIAKLKEWSKNNPHTSAKK
ncbi:MAG: trypsin-like peptidase domain-containing protein [Nitrososphaerales archaeon]|jgi:hypothetical protein